MWIVIKYDKNKLNFVKNNIKTSLGKDVEFYFPKVSIQKYKKKDSGERGEYFR